MYISNMVVEFHGTGKEISEECRKLADALNPPESSPVFNGAFEVRDVVTLMGHLYAGNKIEAIKFFRAKTGWGLRESKEACEGLYPSSDS